MQTLLNQLRLALSCCFVASLFLGCGGNAGPKRILVFSKTEGFRHSSIAAGKQVLMEIGEQNGIVVDTTEEATYFTEDSLAHYSAVVFLNTTQNVLNHVQQADFERYIQAGGGFVGIHAAADTEYDWPWYGRLVGAYFKSHPKVQEAVIRVRDEVHPTTHFLPKDWRRTDEWYNYKNINPNIQVLATLDESSYEGGENGEEHPIAWCHEYDGGRAFYTGGGHTAEAFEEPEFKDHLLAGIQYAMGNNRRDYRKARSLRVPDPERFVKQEYLSYLDEPMELDLLPDGRLIFNERKGAVKIYDPQADQVKTIAQIPVHTQFEDGLLGLALDPKFEENRWIYFFNSPIGEEWVQHISRFTLHENDSLDFASEKVLLKIPVQRETCCHSGGSLEFGPDGNLFISVGDDTNPFNIKEFPYNAHGYAPQNETPGKSSWDAQRSSGNMNDLRGAVLRITPTPEGSYTIPEGNLFPEGTPGTRPEIYTKGCRNPFRIAIDSRRKWLYWGDVGPDAREDNPERGPRGHDEVNQARKAGYFGWPYFVGNNKAYKKFNFQTGVSAADFFDPAQTLNTSPNNTGIQDLPPAQPAFIWYPYNESKEFPDVKSGGRNAMAGPTYYYDDYTGENKIPAYYDGKVIVYDWIRGWMLAVTLTEEGDLEKTEPFLNNFYFSNPVDMIMGPDGAMYVLEYGKGWFSKNPDAKLSRIDFAAGNRAPIARITADKSVGAVPLAVSFSSGECTDFDGDTDFTYEWTFEGENVQSTEANPSYVFEKPGEHKVKLAVTDPSGATSTTDYRIRVGNEPPAIEIAWTGNRSFYWDKSSLPYAVTVTDKEDGVVESGVNIAFDYLDLGEDLTEIAQGHQQTGAILDGEKLMKGSDCYACHQVETASNGPSYREVAERYGSDGATIDLIAGKIINGGSGNWGERPMAAHPGLKKEEAQAMATYILSLDEQSMKASLPMEGKVRPNLHKAGEEGKYIFNVSYTDQGGNEIGPLTSEQTYVLRPARLPADNFFDLRDARQRNLNGTGERISVMADMKNGSWLAYKDIDLRDIGQITLHASANVEGFEMKIVQGSPDGKVLGKTLIPRADVREDLTELPVPIQGQRTDLEDLYIVFTCPEGVEAPAAVLHWIYFEPQATL